MKLDGYRFYLMDTIFLSHLWGFKKRPAKKKTKKESFREYQSYYNAKIFFTFHARELSVRYDTDLKTLKVPKGRWFHKKLRVGIVINPTKKDKKAMQEYLRIYSAFLDKHPGTYGF